jgi:hypothetical protein
MIPDVETDRKFLRIIRLLPRRRRHRNVAKKGGASVFSSSAVPAMVGHVKDQNPRSRIPWVEWYCNKWCVYFMIFTIWLPFSLYDIPLNNTWTILLMVIHDSIITATSTHGTFLYWQWLIDWLLFSVISGYFTQDGKYSKFDEKRPLILLNGILRGLSYGAILNNWWNQL